MERLELPIEEEDIAIIGQGMSLIFLYTRRYPLKNLVFHYGFFAIIFTLFMLKNIYGVEDKKKRSSLFLVEALYVLILFLSQYFITGTYNKIIGPILGAIMIFIYIEFIRPRFT